MSADVHLTLMQWFSPSFPVGAFAYSHGLETAIFEERLVTPDDLAAWCEALISNGSGRNDAILLRAAYNGHDLAELDAYARAFCTSSGRVVETCEQGAAFARTLRGMSGLDVLDAAYPVAVGRAAALMDLPIEATVQAYLQAFVSNLISAAIRRVPLGQTDGQRILHQMQAVILRTAKDSKDATLDDLSATCFAADIAAMQQEELPSRVFRS